MRTYFTTNDKGRSWGLSHYWVCTVPAHIVKSLIIVIPIPVMASKFIVILVLETPTELWNNRRHNFLYLPYIVPCVIGENTIKLLTTDIITRFLKMIDMWCQEPDLSVQVRLVSHRWIPYLDRLTLENIARFSSWNIGSSLIHRAGNVWHGRDGPICVAVGTRSHASTLISLSDDMTWEGNNSTATGDIPTAQQKGWGSFTSKGECLLCRI